MKINIMDHIGLVKSQVSSYRLSCPQSLDYDDLVQVGCMGLLEAAKRYDPEKGAFSTYAVPWIRKFINEELENHRRTIRVPKHAREKASKDGTPYTSTGYEVTDDMIVSESDELENDLDTKQLYQQASKIILQQLDARSQQIVRLRFTKDMPRHQVAEIIGCSKEWVRVLECRALDLIRSEMDKLEDDTDVI